MPQGRVTIEWAIGATNSFELRWVEMDGPDVVQPNRKGVGMAVVERTVRDQLGGAVDFKWRVDGLVCEIAVPFEALGRAQD